MRKCVVVIHPKMSCASLFQKLNKNSKGLNLLLIKILVLKEILVRLISLRIKIILKLLP